jgi:hypothetical protein
VDVCTAPSIELASQRTPVLTDLINKSKLDSTAALYKHPSLSIISPLDSKQLSPDNPLLPLFPKRTKSLNRPPPEKDSQRIRKRVHINLEHNTFFSPPDSTVETRIENSVQFNTTSSIPKRRKLTHGTYKNPISRSDNNIDHPPSIASSIHQKEPVSSDRSTTQQNKANKRNQDRIIELHNQNQNIIGKSFHKYLQNTQSTTKNQLDEFLPTPLILLNKDNESNYDGFIQHIINIINTPTSTPHKPPFQFEISTQAARENYQVLELANFDLQRCIKTNHPTTCTPGSEFRDPHLLHQLLHQHPLWKTAKNLFSRELKCF